MSGFQWPISKIDCINRALAATGNNLCAVSEDGSDEWTVCSPAYEDALAVLVEDSNWGFATKVATLAPSPTAPLDNEWDTAYPLPADLVHIVWVRLANVGASPPLGSPVRYDILAGQLVLNAQGGPPPPSPATTPGIVTLKYVSSDQADPTQATPRFVRALMAYVMSAVYRGLHGDDGEADKMWQEAEALAQRARTRYDQQKPKRQLWNSRITARRRVRGPWPPYGGGWGNTGIPS